MYKNSTHKAIIYIDFNNVCGSSEKFYGRPTMDLDLLSILESMVRRERDLNASQIKCYSGLMPNDGNQKIRADRIALLDHLDGQGVKTFANDLIKNEMGRYQESGIDLKIGVDMAVDILQGNTETIILVSNDRDFEPAIDMIKNIGKKINKEIRVINFTCGNVVGCRNAKKIEIPRELVERHIRDISREQLETRNLLEKKPEEALDAKKHYGKIPKPEPRKTPSLRGSTVFVDINSIGDNAKDIFHRTHLDVDVDKLVNLIAKDTNIPFKRVVGFISQHLQQHDLVNHLLVKSHIDNLEKVRFTVRALPYEYVNTIIGKQNSGAGSNTPLKARLALPKRVAMTIMQEFVEHALNGKCDEAHLVSDDHNLWPMTDLAQALSRATRSEISVRNAHIKKQAIPGMVGYNIDENTYAACLSKDRLAEAKTDAARLIREDGVEFINQLREKYGEQINILVNPTQIEGKVALRSLHWYAFEEENGNYALIRNNLPITPEIDVVYRLDNGRISEVESKFSREQNLRKNSRGK